MNARRTLLLAFSLGILTAAFPSLAQQQGKAWRIGFLSPLLRPLSLETDVYRGFLQRMRELGYVEGKNLIIEWRFAGGDYERLPSIAAELAGLKLDVIVAWGSPAISAMQRATSAIPIVMATSIDPVGSGFAKSLARPGGNITGVSRSSVDSTPKFLELLKTMVPRLSRAAVLVNTGNPGHPFILKAAQTAGQSIGLRVQPVAAHTPETIESGFTMMKRKHAEAVIVAVDGLFMAQRRQIIDLALKNRMLSIFSDREDVNAGGLMSYGQSPAEFFRLAATYVDKVLKGAKPGELPIEQPTRFYLVINRKTASALGLTIPQALLLRADEVIE